MTETYIATPTNYKNIIMLSKRSKMYSNQMIQGEQKEEEKNVVLWIHEKGGWGKASYIITDK